MAKDELASAKIELISKLLSPELMESGSSYEPKKKKSKRSGKSVGEVVSKSSKSKAQKQKAGEAELRRAMKKPRTEPINPKR